MAITGPEDVPVLLSKYTKTERHLYMALSHAKEDEDADKEALIKRQITDANIPDFINRYLMFAQDLYAISQYIQENNAVIKFHEAKIVQHDANIRDLTAEYMAQYDEMPDAFNAVYVEGMHASSSSPSHLESINSPSPTYTPAKQAQQEPKQPPRTFALNVGKDGKANAMRKSKKEGSCTIF